MFTRCSGRLAEIDVLKQSSTAINLDKAGHQVTTLFMLN